MKKAILFFLSLFLFSAAAAAQKLPELAVPHHYILTLAPDFKTDTFTGDEVIHGDTLKATNKIVLNSLEIEFQDVTIQALPGEKNGKPGEVQKVTVTPDVKSEMVTLSFPNEIPAGPFELKIKYKGILNGDLRGFYLSKGNGRKYAVSQMEPTAARRAFPSFDEPAYKAPFDISLIVDKGDTAISNGSIVSDTPGPGPDKHTLKFSMTPKMSTYLVAMMVGDFKCIGDKQDGTPIRVCSTPDKVQYTNLALQDAKDILHFYNQYYAIKYPFKKRTSSPSRTSRRALWRTRPLSPTVKRRCWWTRRTSPTTYARRLPMCSRMKWPTNGSVTWSRCSGGTISGSMRASLPG